MNELTPSPYQRRLMRARTDRERILRDFNEAVNMASRELRAWLDTDESHEVGWRHQPGEESVGHQSGRRIVEILKTPKERLTDQDLLHMRTVVGFIRRHLAQRPRNDTPESRWARSLKNWGHDPTRPSRYGRTR